MYLRVKNVGQGRSYETEADLRNLSDRGVLLRDGRFRIDNMNPGDERLVAFTFEVLPDFAQDEAKLEVSVVDTDLREAITERVVVPIAADAPAPAARTGTVVLRGGAPLRESPSASARTIAMVRGGAFSAPAQATAAGFVRVDIGAGRPAWIADADLVQGAAAPGATVADVINHMPPALTLEYGNALVTREASLRMTGRAHDESLVRDIYIFAGAQKAFYMSNRGAQDPREANFVANVPLHPGINYVTVVARENDEMVGRRMIVVRRDGPDGALLETPAFDADDFGGEAEDAINE